MKGESGRKASALHYERTAYAKALRYKILVFSVLLMVRHASIGTEREDK